MKLHCPDCGERVRADDMHLANLVAKCRGCDAVFSFAGVAGAPGGTRVGPAPSHPSLRAGAAGALLPRPPHMMDEQLGRTWTVSWRWFKPEVLAMLGFVIFWDGFLVFWYTIAFTQHGPLAMKLFPLLHVAVGVTLAYAVLAGLFNRTTIEVSRSEVVIRHRPFPWMGNRRLASADIDQLFCEESRVQRTGGPSFRLCAALGAGEKLTLVSGLRNVGEAHYLEQSIETHLGIAPRAVVGEYLG